MVHGPLESIPGMPEGEIQAAILLGAILLSGYIIWLYWVRQETRPDFITTPWPVEITRVYGRVANSSFRLLGAIIFFVLIALEGMFHIVSLTFAGDPVAIGHLGGLLVGIFLWFGDFGVLQAAVLLLIIGAVVGFVVDRSRVTSAVVRFFNVR